MVFYEDYIAGWLDSSIHDFFQAFPSPSGSMKYALITCLDSTLEPKSLLQASSALRAIAAEVRPLGKGLLLPTRLLLEADLHTQLFFGFDEVWFFPSDSIEPKPRSVSLVGPARIDQKKIDRLGAWMSDNACLMGLGDGEGLNFIVKARGVVKHLLGHSLDQPQPNVVVVASPTRGVAG